jgi:hypothetical protein
MSTINSQDQTSKKFLSLSQVLLNNNKPAQFNQNNNNTLETVDENIVSDKSISSMNSINDFLTVQELFKELELDCDEQIKRLDEKERTQKEIKIKQKEILNEIKINKWFHNHNNQKSSSSPPPPPSSPGDLFKTHLNHNINKLNCSCFSKQKQIHLSKLNDKHLIKLKTLHRIHKRKKLQLVFFALNDSIINKTNNKKNNINNNSLKQQVSFKFKNNKSNLRSTTNNHIKNNIKCIISYSNKINSLENIINLEIFDLKTTNGQIFKNTIKNQMTNQIEPKKNNINETQQSLLDKYYEKYCNSKTSLLKQLTLNSDLSSEYCSLSSAPISSASTSSNKTTTATRRPIRFDINKLNNRKVCDFFMHLIPILNFHSLKLSLLRAPYTKISLSTYN